MLNKPQLFLDRLRQGVSSSVDLSHLAEWIIQNTTDPKNNLRRWSFEHHEFQRAILNDDAAKVVVRKCSQIGLSEIIARMILAMLAVIRQSTAIYTVPTSSFASIFATSRLDPIIENSEVLSSLIDPKVNNSGLKKIGQSFLYIRGTFTQKAAISIPADILINDEVDFSNEQVLTTYASRLGHASIKGGIRREFSTPTVNGFGISKSFLESSQAYYGVKCQSCREWVFPEFMSHVRIPGFEDAISSLSPEDLYDPRYKIDEAHVFCPECGSPISNNTLINPEKRQWVHRFPEREIHGYQVQPFDVAFFNPVPVTLKTLADYSRLSDWVNFKVGAPFEDAETSFLLQAIQDNTTIQWIQPRPGAAEGCVLGCDVGKTSWIVIGKPVGRNRTDIIHMERVRQTGEGALLTRLLELVEYYNVTKAVIDAGPDFTTSTALIAKCRSGVAWANYYLNDKPKNTLLHITTNEAEGISKAVRTESFDLLAKKVNFNGFRFPKCPEMEIMRKHLDNIKRVLTNSNTGDKVANWVATGPEHYAHALNYLNIAEYLLEDRFAKDEVIPVLPMASIVRLKQKA